MTCLPKSLKLKRTVRTSFTTWDPGTRLGPWWGAGGKAPGLSLEAPGFYSIFNAKYPLKSILTHSSHKFSPLGKKLHSYPLLKKWGSRGQSGGPKKAPRVYSIFSAKYRLNLFYFIFITCSCSSIEKRKGLINYMDHPQMIPPMSKVGSGSMGQSPLEAPRVDRVQHFQCKLLSIFYFFYFNTLFLQIFTYRKKVRLPSLIIILRSGCPGKLQGCTAFSMQNTV